MKLLIVNDKYALKPDSTSYTLMTWKQITNKEEGTTKMDWVAEQYFQPNNHKGLVVSLREIARREAADKSKDEAVNIKQYIKELNEAVAKLEKVQLNLSEL